MQWPQWFFVLLFLMSFVHATARWLRDPTLSSANVTARFFMLAAFLSFEVWVLHEGGFW